MLIIGQYQLLLLRIDLIDVACVDDKALTHSHKNTLAIYKMLCQVLLHLSQIQTNNSLQLVNSNKLCTIATSFEINNCGNI